MDLCHAEGWGAARDMENPWVVLPISVGQQSSPDGHISQSACTAVGLDRSRTTLYKLRHCAGLSACHFLQRVWSPNMSPAMGILFLCGSCLLTYSMVPAHTGSMLYSCIEVLVTAHSGNEGRVQGARHSSCAQASREQVYSYVLSPPHGCHKAFVISALKVLRAYWVSILLFICWCVSPRVAVSSSLPLAAVFSFPFCWDKSLVNENLCGHRPWGSIVHSSLSHFYHNLPRSRVFKR